MATQYGTVAPDGREAAPFETLDAPAFVGIPFLPSCHLGYNYRK